jgi:hypothetical protein
MGKMNGNWGLESGKWITDGSQGGRGEERGKKMSLGFER